MKNFKNKSSFLKTTKSDFFFGIFMMLCYQYYHVQKLFKQI